MGRRGPSFQDRTERNERAARQWLRVCVGWRRRWDPCHPRRRLQCTTLHASSRIGSIVKSRQPRFSYRLEAWCALRPRMRKRRASGWGRTAAPAHQPPRGHRATARSAERPDRSKEKQSKKAKSSSTVQQSSLRLAGGCCLSKPQPPARTDPGATRQPACFDHQPCCRGPRLAAWQIAFLLFGESPCKPDAKAQIQGRNTSGHLCQPLFP
jgi:hypothetical protein